MNLIVSGGHFTEKIVEQLNMKDEFTITGSIETAEELVSLLSGNSLSVDVILLLSTSFSQTAPWSANEEILKELIQILALDPSYKRTRLNLLSLEQKEDKFGDVLIDKWGDEGEFEKYLYYKSSSQNINPKFLYSFIKGEKELFEEDEEEQVDLTKNEEKKNKLGLNFQKRDLTPKKRNVDIGAELRKSTAKNKEQKEDKEESKKPDLNFGKNKLDFGKKKTITKKPEPQEQAKPKQKPSKESKLDFNKFKKKSTASPSKASMDVGEIPSSGGLFVFTGLRGVGVTTTASILSYSLAQKEDRVLYIDLDTDFMGSNFLFNEFWNKADGSPTHAKGLSLSIANPDYWEDYITLINSNLYYLGNDLREVQSGTLEIDNTSLISLISAVQTKFKYIIIDLPLTKLYKYSGLIDWSTRYVFLSQNTIPSVCQLAQGLDINSYHSSKYNSKIYPWDKLERKSVGVLTRFKEGNRGLLSKKESTKMHKNLSDKLEHLEFKTVVDNIEGIEKVYHDQKDINNQVKNIYLKMFSNVLK